MLKLVKMVQKLKNDKNRDDSLLFQAAHFMLSFQCFVAWLLVFWAYLLETLALSTSSLQLQERVVEKRRNQFSQTWTWFYSSQPDTLHVFSRPNPTHAT